MNVSLRIRTRRLARACLAVCTAAALVACGGGAGSGTTTPPITPVTPPTAAAPYTLAVSSQPLSVGLSLDTARAVTNTVGSAGGTVTASGVDGTVYTLTVPANAVAADTAITVTPVARFTNLPFNGSDTAAAYGVQLAPEGASFDKVLTLHVALPGGTRMPIDQQLPFSWTGSGQAVALAALDPASAAIDLKLQHFSGWAIARHSLGLSASLGGLRDRLGGSEEARMESAMAERLAAERDKAQQGSTDPGLLSSEQFAAYLAEYDAKVMRPRLAAAGQSCANGRLAMETLLKLARQLQLLGVANTYQEQAFALLFPTATLCIDEEYKKCHDNHIVQDIIPAGLSLQRQAELLGRRGNADYQAWETHADQQIDACHRYTLQFDSTAGNTKPGVAGWDFSEHMVASVKLRLSAPALQDHGAKIVGSDTLASFGYSISYHKFCWIAGGVQQADSQLLVQDLGITVAPGGGIDDFRLVYFPTQNRSTHTKTDNCATPPATSIERLMTWSTVYYVDVLGNPLYFDSSAGPFVDHWTVNQGSSTLATKDIAPILDDGGLGYTAPTHFKLLHTPG